MQGAEPLVSFRRRPSAWRRCKVGKSFAESASRGSPWITIITLQFTQEKTCASHCSYECEPFPLRSTLLLGVPKGLTLGAPSHRCGKSLHRERCGTEPYLSGQLRCFQGDLDGKRGLLLAVVESDDSRYVMPSRFQILSDEFQLVATHGDGPHYSFDHGSWNPGSYGGSPGQRREAA